MLDLRVASPPAIAIDSGAFDLALARLMGFWHKPIRKSSLFLLGILLLCVCGLRADAGLDGMNGYSHDLFVFLDGGWRVLHGQVPYNNFFTDVGTFIHLHTALGLLLAQGRAEGLAYAQALMGCGLGIWAYALAAKRLMPRIAPWAVWILVLLALSPSVIGDPVGEVSVACLYNRYGYVLIAMIILESFFDTEAASPRIGFWAGFSTGASAALLLFIKISYFLGAGFLLLLLFPCRRQVRLRWAGIVVGFAAVFIPFFLYMQSTIVPMWNALQLLAAAKHITILPSTLLSAATANLEMLILVLIAFRLLWKDGARVAARHVMIVSFAVMAAGVFFLLTNYQRGRVPLLPILALLLLQQVETQFLGRPRANLLIRAAVLLWSSVFVIGSLGVDGSNLALAVRFHLHKGWQFSGSRFESPRLCHFRDLEPTYVALVNDGIHLVERYRARADTVASLDFSNPFSYALGMSPPWGGTPIGLQYKTNFDDGHKLPPDFLFGHASLVIVPNVFTDTTLQESIPRIYGPFLEAHFHLIGQTPSWRLYRMNN